MRLIYLNYITNPELATGILKKLNSQAKILKKLGVNVDTIVFHVEGRSFNNFTHIHFYRIPMLSKFIHSSTKKIWGFLRKWTYAERFLLQRPFDFILMRYPLADFMLLQFIKKYGDFVIFEHQTKEITELCSLKSLRSYVKILLEKKYGKKILERTRGIIGVTPEIVDYELSRINFLKPYAIISNGINVKEIPLRKQPLYTGKELHLLFIGTNNLPWHGIDRVLKGIALYKKPLPRITLHLVGNFTNKIKKMIQNLKIENRVYLYGNIYGNEINRIFDLTHIAIGTLALHRNQMKQACPLKVREYTARGIPFVIAYDDVDLMENLPFYLKFPAEDSPINMEELIIWANDLLKKKNISSYMREYALKKMDCEVKMTQLKDFLEKLI